MVLVNPGIVFLVGAGPGDPGLITLRGVECLRQAEVVIHDRLINHSLLKYAPSAEWIDVGKQPDNHSVPQAQINALLVKHALAGQVVVRLKGGDPFVFGRGGEEALALVEAGVAFEIVPGISSAVAAPAYAGIPITHRNLACSAAIITGHRADCTDDPETDWTRAARGCDTLVFLMGVKNLPRIVARVLAGGRSPQTPVALISQATCQTQEVVIGSLSNIVERSAGISPPAVIVIGEVAGMHEQLSWFQRPQTRPLTGLRVLNTRPGSICAHPLDGYSDEFSQRLYEQGSQVLEAPAVRVATAPDSGALLSIIHDLTGSELASRERPASARRPFDWLVFTSPNGAVHFFEALFGSGADSRACSGLKLAASCCETTGILKFYGLTADFSPSHPGAIHLACELPAPAGQRILMPRSEPESDEALDILKGRGAQVVPLPVCTVEPAAYDPGLEKTLLQGNFDLVTFFSSTAVDGLVKLAGEHPLDIVLKGKPAACAGEETARAAEQRGLQVEIVVDDPTVEGMLEALVKWRGR